MVVVDVVALVVAQIVCISVARSDSVASFLMSHESTQVDDFTGFLRFSAFFVMSRNVFIMRKK